MENFFIGLFLWLFIGWVSFFVRFLMDAMFVKKRIFGAPQTSIYHGKGLGLNGLCNCDSDILVMSFILFHSLFVFIGVLLLVLDIIIFLVTELTSEEKK